MQVRCRHCRNPIELTEDSLLDEVDCPSCGSSFSLVGTEETKDYAPGTTRRIAHFELISQLGVGAFGAVWRARDTELDREVAIKIPRKGQLSPEESEKFLREARTAAQLNHPGIVSVHEVGRDNDGIYIVSDLVEGVTLTDWLSGHRPTLREAAGLCARIADALQHAHEKGVTHRDLKPGNLMIDRQGDVYLMDFGLAKRDAGEVTMTIDGQVLGTPAYLSPEAARGDSHNADARSDIYSLGVILFEMLTGERPFRGNARMLIHQLLTEDPPSPRKLNGAIPKDLETICLKCLENDPRNRYGTAKLVSNEFHRFLDGEPVHARPISGAERAWRWCRRNARIATMASTIVLLILVLAVVGGITAVYQKLLRAETEQQLYISDMNAARQAWDDSNIALVDDLLRRHIPKSETDLRGFEWYHLQWLLNNTGAAQRIPIGISREVAYCPTRPLVAVSTTDRVKLEGQIVLVNTESGKTVRRLGRFDGGWITFVEFSTDGRWLVYPGEDCLAVRAFDMINNENFQFGEGDSPITAVAFWGGSGKLVLGRNNGSIQVVDMNGRENSVLLDPVAGEVRCLAVSPTEDLLAVATGNAKQQYAGSSITTNSEHEDEVRIINLQTTQTVGKIDNLPAPVNDLAFLPNRHLAAACEDSASVEVWSTNSMEHLASLREHEDAVRSVAVSSNGFLASASRDNTIKLWNFDTLSCMDTLKGHSGIVDAVAFSREGDKLVSGSQDYTAIIWDLTMRGLHGFLEKGRFTQLTCVENRLYAKSVDDEQLVAWSLSDRQPLEVLNGFSGKLDRFAISTDGVVALTETEGNISVWDLMTGESKGVLHPGILAGDDESWKERQQLAFSPSGELLAAVINDGRVLVWQAPFSSRKPCLTLTRPEDDVLALAFDHSGKFLATGHRDKQVRVWNAKDGSLKFESTGEKGHRDKVMCLAFTSDGDLLASGGFDNTIKIWNFNGSSRPLATLRGHSASIHQLLFSKDNRTLFSAGGDQTVRLWDTRTYQERYQIGGHSREVHGIAISADEEILATAGVNGVRLWYGPRDAR